MDTVVIPIADSLDPRYALRTGFSVAQRAGAEVVLVSACAEDDRERVQQTLDDDAARFAGVAASSTRVVTAPPVDALLELAESDRTLLAMSTHARRGIPRLVLGSVADEVIRRASHPILCIGPSARGVFLPGERVRGLVCTDDSEASDRVVGAAAEFAAAIEASCNVVQVVGPDEDVALDGGPSPRPLRERAHQHCGDAAARIADAGVDCTHEVLPGDAAGAIVQYAETTAAGFIVIGTSGRSGLARITLGSVASDVVRSAPCPVLVVPIRADG